MQYNCYAYYLHFKNLLFFDNRTNCLAVIKIIQITHNTQLTTFNPSLQDLLTNLP